MKPEQRSRDGTAKSWNVTRLFTKETDHDGLLPTGKPSSPGLQTTWRLGNTAMKRESSPGL